MDITTKIFYIVISPSGVPVEWAGEICGVQHNYHIEEDDDNVIGNSRNFSNCYENNGVYIDRLDLQKLGIKKKQLPRMRDPTVDNVMTITNVLRAM